MATIRNAFIGVVLTVSLALFVGCGESTKVEQKAAAQPPKPQASQTAAPVPEEPKAEKEVYRYDAKGRRDPFVSLIAVAMEKPKARKKANPVENFDVDEIVLSAIVSDKQQFYASVKLPDGKSYTVRKGMILGLYGGKIEEITKDTVRIQEQVKDYRGQLKTKDTILKLRKEGEE